MGKEAERRGSDRAPLSHLLGAFRGELLISKVLGMTGWRDARGWWGGRWWPVGRRDSQESWGKVGPRAPLPAEGAGLSLLQ